MKILIVDDHAVVRQGVRRLLSEMKHASIFEASNGEEALAIFRKERPKLVLLDLNLPGIDGLELLRRMIGENKRVRIVVFTVHAEPVYAVRALKLGARAYVSKSAGVDELVTAIERVADGGSYVESEMAGQLAVARFVSDAEDPLRQLSNREIEILRLLGQGKTLTEIARTTGVAYKTVANACSKMKSKLGVGRTADLIRLSMQLNR
jgi:two-component system, NarL family, invasion response regulator UvrY